MTARVVDAVEQPTWTALAVLFVLAMVAGGVLLLLPGVRQVCRRLAARHG